MSHKFLIWETLLDKLIVGLDMKIKGGTYETRTRDLNKRRNI